MSEFEVGGIDQIDKPIGAGAESLKLSRSDRAGIIVATLVSLALYPQSQELTDVIGEQVIQFDKSVVADAKKDDPEVLTGYSIDLDSEVLTRDNLLARYHAAGHKAYEPWAPLWNQFSDIELNKRGAHEQVSEPEKPFQGRIVGWLQGGDHKTEKGLYLVGKKWEQQQELAQAKIDGYAAEGRNSTGLLLPSWGDFVLAHAAEAEAHDGVVLDANTYSRLVQYDMKPVDVHGVFGPPVCSLGGGLCSDRSYGGAYPDAGVRFLMEQILTGQQTSPS